MKQLPLNALRVFESVARCGSFKQAAEELSVSQSAISHQIKHLEIWLDKPLFDRSGSRPLLLPQAHVLADTINRALSNIDIACKNLSAPNDTRSLVIAAVPSVAVCWLIPRLADFNAQHPDIATHIVYNLEGRQIDFNKVDLAFTFSNAPPTLPNHDVTLFQTGISVPVCSPKLRDSIDKKNLPQTIISAGLLHDSTIDGWTDWLQRSNYQSTAPISGPVYEDFNLLRTAALAGQGVALCPLALIASDLESGQLVQLSDTAINEDSNYYLIKRKATSDESASEQFSTWVLKTLEHRR